MTLRKERLLFSTNSPTNHYHVFLLSTFCLCCVKSACNREKITFDYSLEDFADNVDQEDILSWAELVSEPEVGTDGSEAKKN